MSQLAIVAVGYNRPDGLNRLLHSLERASYGDDSVTLIISVDNSGSPETEKAARSFHWTHGEKRVRTFPERQGLRRHILSCGEFLREFDAIAVLEDDLVVSPAFYTYMQQAVSYYADEEGIAGVSLYAPRTNINNLLPFTPESGMYDVYLMQVAQSWGQIWLKKQWFAFMEWYEKKAALPLAAEDFPHAVSGWPETSWLKYHIKYCVAENKFFVYPYCALSTCFDEAGTHEKKTLDRYNVPISAGGAYRYTFAPLDTGIRYDVFYERIGLERALSLPEGSLCTDIYGSRESFGGKRYVLTRQCLPYEKLASFALRMRPQECNILYGQEGEDIFLYDTDVSRPAVKEKKTDRAHKTVDYYYNIACKFTDVLRYSWYRIVNKIKRK